MKSAVVLLLLLCVLAVLVDGVDIAEKASELANIDSSKVKHTIVHHTAPMRRRPKSGRVINMKNKIGNDFECVIPKLGDPVEEPEPVIVESKPAKPTLQSKFKPFTGKCIVRGEGYWNYELCHGKSVRQFHFEPNGQATEYSLGNFVSSSEESGAKETDEGTLIHKHTGGTRCDETGGGRATTVRYRCGAGEADQITSIVETSVCNYVMTFVSNSLCFLFAPPPSSSAAPPVKLSARDFLAPLAGSCFYMIEGWWTYEFCYGKHIRQFHQENKVVKIEYMLGDYIEKNNVDLEPVRPTDDTAPFFTQHYSQGTICDLTGEPRKTEVQIQCAHDSQNMFVSIKERTSCSYQLIFTTPLICNHPAFHTAEDPALVINCYPKTVV